MAAHCLAHVATSTLRNTGRAYRGPIFRNPAPLLTLFPDGAIRPTQGDRSTSYSLPFSVTQGPSSRERAMYDLVMGPSANHDWDDGYTTYVVIYAACESNVERAEQNNWLFNCNIAFAGGDQLSFWASPSVDGTTYAVDRRAY